jgi:putative flavoprotein involved in K+ transport
MSEPRSADRFDVVVIGGGQAGLATGYHLGRQGLRFAILDAHDRVGDTWRERWDSLRLFTPARLNGLPGMPFPAAPGSTVTKNAMADYLESYARHFKLPVCLGTAADSVSLEGGGFVVRARGRQFQADQVVVATGGHSEPTWPGFAVDLDHGVLQMHSIDYRNPAQLRAGGVLVVGAGNSGAEIAVEAAAAHPTWLSGRSTGKLSPALYARPSWWLLKRISDVRTPIGRRVRARTVGRGTPLVRLRDADLAAAGVTRVGRVVGVQDGRPRLGDGQLMDVANVVWCTGFSHDFSWIRVSSLAQPGLHFVGLPFQSNLASALIDGVGHDAEHIAHEVVQFRCLV